MHADLEKTAARAGGIAGLTAALTYIIGFALFATMLEPSGYGRAEADPAAIAAFLAENQGLMLAWNMAIYVVNAVAVAVLALALQVRLADAAPFLSRAGAGFGLIWAGLLLAAGMIASVTVRATAELHGTDPAAAADLWQVLNLVENGLGGGNEIAGAIWVLAVSAAAWKGKALPAALNLLGLAIGLCGLLTVIPATGDVPGAVFGLGFIGWFAWAGICLLRGTRRVT